MLRRRSHIVNNGLFCCFCTVILGLLFRRINTFHHFVSTSWRWQNYGGFEGSSVALRSTRDFAIEVDSKDSVNVAALKHTLLTFDKELALATDYQKAKQLILIDKHLSQQLGRKATDAEISEKSGIPEEQIESFIDKGYLAKKLLVKSNMRLVLHIAGFYKNRGLGLGDLVQEGCNGLDKAIDKYDPRKGFRFSTYASWWIKQAVARAVAEKSRVVRLPVHIHDMVISLNRIEEAFWSIHCRYPTNAEIAHHMAISTTKVALLKKCSRDARNAEDLVPGGASKDFVPTLSALLMDQEVDVDVDEHSTMRAVQQLNQYDLNERERSVLEMRYGLHNGRIMTLEEVGKELNVTRERVRQIESRSMLKMKEQQSSLRPRRYTPQRMTLTVSTGVMPERQSQADITDEKDDFSSVGSTSSESLDMSVLC